MSYEDDVEWIRRERAMYYADSAEGSDSLFIEVWRMKEMGEPGWELKLEAAKARFLAIQAQWPWPTPPAPPEEEEETPAT